MRVLDLFSGIGGFSLGLERAGMRTVAFCEIDPFCRSVLAQQWPGVPIYEDVRHLPDPDLTYYDRIDLICGGFPCQDISYAGRGAGIDGARSGLWSEFARLIGDIRPQWAIVENVSALLARGLDRVLGDLAALGYDAEWYCIPASAVGAPHIRDRVWIIAYPQHPDANVLGPYRAQEHYRGSEPRDEQGGDAGSLREILADAESGIRQRQAPREAGHAALGRQDMAHTYEPRLERWLRESLRECAGERASGSSGTSVSDADSIQENRPSEPWRERGQWLSEPDVGRVANGVPARVDRLRSLGNAVVPQIPEIIGRAILKAASTETPHGKA